MKVSDMFTKELLETLLKTKTIRGIAREYGVSPSPLFKLVKKYGLKSYGLECIDIIKKIYDSLGFRYSIYKNHTRKQKLVYVISLLGGKKEVRRFLELVQPSIPRKRWCERQNG